MAQYLVGSAVLLALAGCAGSFVAQRDPWRRDAEIACMKSGSIKQSATVVPIRPIEGPGVCGATMPLKVAAIGEGSSLAAYAESLRPPGGISGQSSARPFPIPEPREPQYARQSTEQRPFGERPMQISPPGSEPEEEEPADEPYDPQQSGPNRPESRPPPRLGPQKPLLAFAATSAAVQPTATLACPLVSQLDKWMAGSVQPAAQRWFGQPVAEIKQISAYSCRGMNGQRGAPISEHAFGNALDIAGFTLADGRKVTVKNGWHGTPEEQGFLRDVHAAACEQFSTVLAPGSNRFHYDHIHVDLARRRSGRSYCNPRAIPGDLIAQQAHQRRLGFAPEEPKRGLEPLLPRAIPGED
ncbi:extensin family protein [Variibacter gotjawalensis]|uniref:extensin-like domain-containing protein n=1 Tax=Variibacter gotjawalensis TaxID=1333996 RepID=UPI001D4FDCE6|nr:extensin family protein [Variibacter gotjawalensis]NIK45732.1 hypothetical protein [Variibacter gotjawalensis]